MKIKVCGITKTEDAVLCSRLGAWAVGFIFVKESPRYISTEKASEITAELLETIEKIGVFVNSTIDEIQATIQTSKITRIQLHGDETPDFCTELKKKTSLPIIKAFRVNSIEDIDTIKLYKNIISAVLLDTFDKNQHGGTGKTFNWEIAKKAKEYEIPLILAGGINPDNILNAYAEVKPFAIDVSSGVEISPGIKDHEKLKNLFK